jgi:superfamily I DNA/RNA helicase
VACTRAKDQLYLCYPLVVRDRYRVDIVAEPSRFLRELPSGLYQQVVLEPPQEVPDFLEEGDYQLPPFLKPSEDF